MSAASASVKPAKTAKPKSALPGWLVRWQQQAWWPWAKRIVVGGFLLFVVTLLVIQARSIEWDEVFSTMRQYPVGVLALAAALGAASHVIYSTFDLVGRHYTGHRLPAPTVMAITFVSYAFNLNLGTVVGAVAMRVRLYSRLGLDAATITRIVGTSMLTNWLGYFLLAGLAFIWWPKALPADWHIGIGALHAMGGLLVAVALAYVGACAFSKRREWTVRGHEISLPSFRVALVQLALSSANWAMMGATMFVLLQGKVEYPMVLGVLLIGAVAGLLSRVPAGLGVLEAVFIAVLAPPLQQAPLIAAVLLYRTVYYWAPLLVAALLYMVMEANARRLSQSASAG